VTRLDVIRYRDTLEEEGKAGATIALRLAALASFYAYAKGRRLIDENPVEGVERPKTKPYQSARWLTSEQARKLLALPDRETLVGKRDYALLLMALTTGLRRSEIVGIHRGDLMEHPDGSVMLRYRPKGGETQTRPLPKVVWAAIRDYLEARGEVADDDPVFVAHDKAAHAREVRALTPEGFRLIVERYTRKALGRAVNPHALRHTAATRLWALTRDPKAVQMLLGHSNIAVTERYLHQVEDRRGELGDLLAEDLGLG